MHESEQHLEVKPEEIIIEIRPAGLLNTLFEKATRGRLGVDELVFIPHANQIVRRAYEEDKAVRVKDLATKSKLVLARRG